MVFQTRWTLSYLRGPLSRDQIRRAHGRCADAADRSRRRQPPRRRRRLQSPAARRARSARQERPIVPPGIEQFFVPRVRRAATVIDAAGRPRERPRRASPTRRTASTSRATFSTRSEISDGAVPVDWTAASSRRRPCRQPRFATPAALGPARARAVGRPAGKELRQLAKGVQPLARAIRDPRALPPPRLEARPHILARASATSVSASQDANRAARDEAVDAMRRRVRHEAGRSSLNACVARKRPSNASSSRSRRAGSRPTVSVGTTLVGAFLGRKPSTWARWDGPRPPSAASVEA